MSSLAQEESRSISENTTWGKRKQFAEGKYEDGLTEAIAIVTPALIEQYPASGEANTQHKNELPDGPVVLG